jgi:hypothetical protein
MITSIRFYSLIAALLLFAGTAIFAQGKPAMINNVNWLIKPQYESALEFQEGLAIVQTTEADGYQNGYITKKNRMVIGSKHLHSLQPSRNGIIEYSEYSILYRLTKLGDSNKSIRRNTWNNRPYPKDETVYPSLERFSIKGKGSGYRDAAGRVIVKPGTFIYQGEFREGLAMVFIKRNETILAGFIDATGAYAIPPRYFQPSQYGFHEGLCAFMDKEKDLWGYMDRAGNTVIEPVFDNALDFTEGCAAVEYQGLWGFIRNPLGYRE